MGRWAVVAVLMAVAGCARVHSMLGTGGVVRAYVVHHGEPAWKRLFADFERETGTRVEVHFACRGANLVSMAAEGKDGDLFITDSPDNVKELGKKGLSESAPVQLGEITPVVQVMKGNPKKIASLADLARPGVRVVLCFPKGCLGRVSDQILAKSGLTEKVAPNIVKRIPGEQGVALAVDGLTVDAAIMWSWVFPVIGPERYEQIPIPPEANVIDPIVALRLKTARNSAGAEKLLAFLQTERAQKLLAEARLARPK